MSAQTQLANTFSTDHLQADLKGRSVRGVMATLTSQGSLFLIQSVSIVVLARILTPADFGLVAMVTAISDLATPFADLGLSQATIQRKEITHDQVSALFWINTIFGLVFAIVMAAFGPLLAKFYREPRLTSIAVFVALIFLIVGLRAQPEALLKRQMRFSALALRNNVSLALGVLVAIGLAWRGWSYWAIVAIPVVAQFSQMALAWCMIDWRPTLPRRWTEVRSMVAFGGNVAASFLVFGIHRNVDNVLIGWYWGAGPLGLYSRAYSLLMLPIRQLNAPIASVAIPAFSRIQSNPERFARYYLRAVSLIIWIGAPIFSFLVVGADPVIRLMLGEQWRGAGPVFQILAISALGQLLLQSTVWLSVSRGESARLFKLLLLITPAIIASFLIGLPFGIKGVALSYSIVLLSVLPWFLKAIFRGTNLTLGQIGAAIAYPGALCLVSVLLAVMALHFYSPSRPIPRLLMIALGFFLTYLTASLIPRVRQEFLVFADLVKQLRPTNRGTWPVAKELSSNIRGL